MPRTTRWIALLAAASLLVPACKKKEDPAAPGPAGSGAIPAKAPGAAGGPAAPAAPTDGWSDEQAKNDLTLFYNTTAEWSGKFVLAKVLQMRVDAASDTQRVANVEYAFEPVRGNPRQNGTDRRTFEFANEGGKWIVKSMGANESASFGPEAEGWSDAQAIAAAIAHYDAKGEWAGKFKLATVRRYRVDRTGPGKKTAYIEYGFEPLPGNKRPAAVDKRAFKFARAGSAWQLQSMGGFMSAAAAFKR